MVPMVLTSGIASCGLRLSRIFFNGCGPSRDAPAADSKPAAQYELASAWDAAGESSNSRYRRGLLAAIYSVNSKI
jgi:hypothetical protein